MFIKKILRASILICTILFVGMKAEPSMALSGNHQVTQSITSAELEAFVDEYTQENLATSHVPGLVVVVVQDGAVLLSKGYGYADIDNRIPMTPQTVVRAGSVSKPVTASAIIQLVEQGLLDLKAPVDEYITDLDLEDDYGQASTIAQLLNHMGGYEDAVVRSHAPAIEAWQPLRDVLAEDLPLRAFAPGKVMSYSSWDYALLGYAMEQVTGLPYEEAIAKNLFVPLGMESSTFLQPLPANISDDLAIGYGYNDRTGTYDIIPHDFVRMSPGVALVTTGEDMGTYMLMLLNGGRAKDGTQVFNDESIALILERQTSAHPYSRGRSYAFNELTLANRKVLYHDGNGIGFMSRLVLSPEHNTGIFISTNHRNLNKKLTLTQAARLTRNLSEDVLEKVVPASEFETPAAQPLPDAKDRTNRFVGYYQPAHLSRRDFFKVEALLDNVTVKDNGDGMLKIGSSDYVEVEPMVFQSQETPTFFVVFVENDLGEVEFLTFGGTGSYQKVSLYQSQNFQIALTAIIILVFLSFLITWPFKRQGHWLAWVVSLFGLAFFAGVVLLFTEMTDLLLFFKSIPRDFYLLLILPWIIGLLSLTLLGPLVKNWKNESFSSWGRIHYSLVILAGIACFGLAQFWNLTWI